MVQHGKVIFYTCGASAFALGVVDSFAPNPANAVYALAVQSDGKILV